MTETPIQTVAPAPTPAPSTPPIPPAEPPTPPLKSEPKVEPSTQNQSSPPVLPTPGSVSNERGLVIGFIAFVVIVVLVIIGVLSSQASKVTGLLQSKSASAPALSTESLSSQDTGSLESTQTAAEPDITPSSSETEATDQFAQTSTDSSTGTTPYTKSAWGLSFDYPTSWDIDTSKENTVDIRNPRDPNTIITVSVIHNSSSGESFTTLGVAQALKSSMESKSSDMNFSDVKALDNTVYPGHLFTFTFLKGGQSFRGVTVITFNSTENLFYAFSLIAPGKEGSTLSPTFVDFLNSVKY